jgi:hypothetical protein
LASPKVLTFGKTQINLVFPSLNRTFAPKKNKNEFLEYGIQRDET